MPTAPDSPSGTPVARVVGLWRYPVKSMAAEALARVEVDWQGLAGDRRWAFVRPGAERDGFPWLTIRERPAMTCYRPRFRDATRPETSTTLVETPEGRTLDVVDPRLAEELAPGSRVLRHDRGLFDAFPVSLVSTQTVAGLAREIGARIGAGRFRPNLLVEALDADACPYPEEAWVGATLCIGGLRLRIDKRDRRCTVVNVDPATARVEPAVLRAIGQGRAGYLGVYGSTVAPGLVAVGDEVRLL